MRVKRVPLLREPVNSVLLRIRALVVNRRREVTSAITPTARLWANGHLAPPADLFGEGEFVLFRMPHECREKIGELLSDTRRIEQIAAAGRERSLRRHCWKHPAADVGSFILAPDFFGETNGPAGRLGVQTTRLCCEYLR